MPGLSKDPAKRAASLANLKKITKENADEYREKGLKVRRERKEALENLKVAAKDLEDMGSLTVLRGLLQQALDTMDAEQAIKIATTIAEYEAPKLQRQEIDQRTTVTELSDEELAEELAKLDEQTDGK